MAAVLILVLGAARVQAQTAPPAGQDIAVVDAARVAGDAQRSRFVADLSKPVSYNVYVIAAPYRVIVDMAEVSFQLPKGLGQKGRGLVTAYRYGRLEEGRSRIVMDVTGPVLIEKSFIVPPQDGAPARMVVDLVATDEKTFAAMTKPPPEQPAPAKGAEQVAEATPPPPAPKSVAPEQPPAPQPPAVQKQPQAVLDAITSTPAPDAHPAETPVTAPPAETVTIDLLNGTKAKPQAAQPETEIAAVPIPLPATEDATAGAVTPEPTAEPPALPDKPVDKPKGKKVIVLDPGHGGIDPGASSPNGTQEKDIVLALAKAMREKLLATGRYTVLMTRDDDTFVSLPNRVRFARDNRADLFIALHADSLRGPTVRGATVYTLSEKASDAEAEALAEKENKADMIAGVNVGDDNIAGILIDLAQRETKNASVSLAKKIVLELKGVTDLTKQPHRSAGFRVLRAPDVPSVLLEAGYLSSKADVALLTSDDWREKVSVAMVEALDAYFGQTVAAGQ